LAIGDPPPLEMREQDMLSSMGMRNAPNPGQSDVDGEAMANS
jgi:hypothetical protein